MNVRLGARVAAFVGSTAYQLARLEAERGVAPEPQREAIRHRRVAAWARQLLGIFHVEVHGAGPYLETSASHPGTDPRGIGRMFIFNHRSGLDILVTLAFFQGMIVSRADLAGWPLVGIGARRIGTLFVDRANAKSGAAVIGKMTRALAAGTGVCIYPEGTAFEGDEVRPLHPGGFRAASRAGAEIVPVGLSYADPRTVYGDESFLAHLERVASMERVVVAVDVGEPFLAEGSLDDLRARGRVELQCLVDRARSRLRAADAK